MQASKSVQPSLIFFGQLFGSDFVGAGCLGRRGLISLGEHDDPLRFADPVRQHDRAADQLVGLLRIDSQADRDIDGLVELRRVELLEDGHRLIDRHRRLVGRHLLGHHFESFGELDHDLLSDRLALECS